MGIRWADRVLPQRFARRHRGSDGAGHCCRRYARMKVRTAVNRSGRHLAAGMGCMVGPERTAGGAADNRESGSSLNLKMAMLLAPCNM